MIYLAYIVICFSSVNIVIGLVLYIKKDLNLKLRNICYASTLVQLPLVFILIAFAQKVIPLSLMLITILLFFLGYFIPSRLTRGVTVKRDFKGRF